MARPTSPALRLAADSAAVLTAFALSYALRQWGPIRALRFPIQPLAFYLPLLPLAAGLLLGILWQQGLYERGARAASLPALVKMLRAIFLWVILLMALSYGSQQDPSRALLLLVGAATPLLIAGGRSALRAWEERGPAAPLRTVVVGASGDTDLLRRACALGADIETVGTVPATADALTGVATLLTRTRASAVAILDSRLSQEEALNIVAAIEPHRVRCLVPPDRFPLLRENQLFLDRGSSLVALDLSVADRSLWARGGKRAFDVGVSLLLLPLIIPLSAAIAVAIWADSGRPILFSHERVGRQGRAFRMRKFRTMAASTPALADAPRNSDDARVTRLGRFLRRASLDELPQLWNIIRGDMSLVGPRPEMPHLVAQYAPWQRLRLRVRPGLTGLWQILGRKEHPLHEHLEYDVYYVNNVSISLDLAIILKTLPRILSGRGAF